MVNECQKSTLRDLFKNFLSDTVSKQITKDCSKIFPLENVLIKKVKVLKKPKFDLTKLMELYQANTEKQAKISEEPANALTAGQ
jgi:small subunit ribosomal protein S3Ae